MMAIIDKKTNTYNFVDLFCGAGGFTEGFLLADHNRFRLVAASDVNSTSMLTHTKRYQDQLSLDYFFLTKNIMAQDFIPSLVDGIEKIIGSKGEVDVVCGGPPCQGFSIFGPRKEKDPRNALFGYYLKVIEELKPKYFIMENVPGLAQMYRGKVVGSIYKKVENIMPKYNFVGPLYINSADFGVPQIRERIIFVGSRFDVPKIDSVHPIRGSKRYITCSEAIHDLSFLQAWEKAYSYSEEFTPSSRFQRESRRGRLLKKMRIAWKDKPLFNHEAARHSPEVIARFAMIRKGKGLESIPRPLWEKHLSTEKKWCVKLDDGKPAYTVVTLPDDFVHYATPRILTVRELARLQSFDDSFIFYGPRSTGGGGVGNRKRRIELPQYTQVGNAVPPLVAQAIATRVLEALDAISISSVQHSNVVPLHKVG
ncbi:MAG: DNA cytosine methyltransferase [Cyanobacteria bacterium P01_G01_bin.54]